MNEFFISGDGNLVVKIPQETIEEWKQCKLVVRHKIFAEQTPYGPVISFNLRVQGRIWTHFESLYNIFDRDDADLLLAVVSSPKVWLEVMTDDGETCFKRPCDNNVWKLRESFSSAIKYAVSSACTDDLDWQNACGAYNDRHYYEETGEW